MGQRTSKKQGWKGQRNTQKQGWKQQRNTQIQVLHTRWPTPRGFHRQGNPVSLHRRRLHQRLHQRLRPRWLCCHVILGPNPRRRGSADASHGHLQQPGRAALQGRLCPDYIFLTLQTLLVQISHLQPLTQLTMCFIGERTSIVAAYPLLAYFVLLSN